MEQCKNAYEATGQGQSALSQWPYFRDWRNAYGDLLLNASSLQHTLRRLDKAFAAFFRRVKAGEKPGYPRFKGAGRFDSVAYTYGDGVWLDYDDTFDRFVLRNITAQFTLGGGQVLDTSPPIHRRKDEKVLGTNEPCGPA